MANKNLFKTNVNSVNVPATNAVNNAGGIAYSRTDKHALALLAATGTFNSTFYVDADANLELVKNAVKNLRGDPEFVAKVAVYARQSGYMKDMPAFLVVQLAAWGETELLRKVFPKVIDNGKMLRNFMQIGRSGQCGKVINMSSGAVRKLINDWFANHDGEYIFKASIGNDPSMRDMLRMARPKPIDAEHNALFAYLKGAELDGKSLVTRNKDGSKKYSVHYRYLPQVVKDFEEFKKTKSGEIPDVDFRMLDSILDENQIKGLWEKNARNGNWHFTRMNLNNFNKYGVFKDPSLVKLVANRLKNKTLIQKSNVYPYQLLVAYENATDIPVSVREALQDAMEIAVDNVPEVDGESYVLVDSSGSMQSSITGNRPGATSVVKCVQVAGLIGSAFLRKNKSATVLPFDTSVHPITLNPRDSVMTNARLLARSGGGTDCSCALRYLNDKNAKGNLVVFVSDNESWYDSYWNSSRGTSMQKEWKKFKDRNPKAKLVCIDLTPNITSQVTEHEDILQVGGFSDTVFDVVSSFAKFGRSKDHWLKIIEETSF